MNDHEMILHVANLRSQIPLTLDPRRTALLVIDMQRYFVRPGYAFSQLFEGLMPGSTAAYFQRVREVVVPGIKQLLSAFRAAGSHVVFTGTGTCTGDGADLPPWLRDLDALGGRVLGRRVWPAREDPAWQIDESVAPLPGEIVVNKTSSDAFSTTSVDQALRQLGADTAVVAGLTTDVCVNSTARQAADRGYTVIVVEDACTTLSEEMHRAALFAIRLALGRVSSTEEVIRLLGSPVTRAAPG